ncbi:MAG: dephospho-CoA kinase [Myxococcales bacterium FL481]|nr:MAG: dephospho-CoA kinase [Myxococcales bacterium FL481]
MDVYGLTGGIGSGKSAVGALLAGFGVPVVAADELARLVVSPGSEGLALVVEAFGEEVLSADGELDRRAMGRLVFADPSRREQLETILHPCIQRRYQHVLAGLAAAGHGLVVYEVPLLFENGLEKDMRGVAVVYAAPEIRVARVRARDGLRDEEIQARMAAQLDDEEKFRRADYVLYNDGSRDDLRREVEWFATRFLKLPRQRFRHPPASAREPTP